MPGKKRKVHAHMRLVEMGGRGGLNFSFKMSKIVVMDTTGSINAKAKLSKIKIFLRLLLTRYQPQFFSAVLFSLVWSSVRVSRARRWSVAKGNETGAINTHQLGSFARNWVRAKSRPS